MTITMLLTAIFALFGTFAAAVAYAGLATRGIYPPGALRLD